MKCIAFCKPFRVMSQFSPSGAKSTLADYLSTPGIYPAGRLDYDSEGLLLLTDHGPLQHAISHPRGKHWKRYWVQVEGRPDASALQALRDGIELRDGKTRPARVKLIGEPDKLWPRDPPIRHRLSVPTSWLEVAIQEGRNRQVRRMTAAAGTPTLRLIRAGIGPITLENLRPGQARELTDAEIASFRPATIPRRSRPRRRHPHTPSHRG